MEAKLKGKFHAKQRCLIMLPAWALNYLSDPTPFNLSFTMLLSSLHFNLEALEG